MFNYEELGKLAQNASAEEKLQTMRNILKNPLTAIRGYAELIRISAEQGEIQNVEKWSTTLIETIDDLGSFIDSVTSVPKSDE